MQGRRGDDPRPITSEPTLRLILRRLREIMSGPGDGQSRLDKIVRQVAALMVAEVCSIYVMRQDRSLELFATEGLNPEAVHNTRMKRGEGLVGRCAELAIPINEPEARSHPSFSYRPETGEEVYHSLLAVPILRAGAVLGVIVVQNRKPREYSEDDVEVLLTTAMLIAEMLLAGDIAGAGASAEMKRVAGASLKGETLSDGIALGHVVLHEPRVVVTTLLAEDPVLEEQRLDTAILDLRAKIDEMLAHETLSQAGAHRDVLEAYRLFANDRGWLRRMRDAVREGLTADAAVERVQNETRARMLRQNDPFWRERLRDLDDLSDRLLRILAGFGQQAYDKLQLPEDTVLVARNMGPAELLDYDRSRVRGLVVEDGSAQSHVAIVAKALGIAAVGQIPALIERVVSGDAIIVDGEAGEVHLRPAGDVVQAFADKVRLRARRQARYHALRSTPPVTKDGQRVELHINAGLMVDMAHLDETGADGVGLFRTELQFMIASTFPRVEQQTRTYSSILKAAGERPVTFRVLDIGGDKALPYMRQPKEDNPAIGWRAVRMALDRPALLRMQTRAMLRSAGGCHLRIMIPMVATVEEMVRAKEIIAIERRHVAERGYEPPASVKIGAMIEVPSLIMELPALMGVVDFVSVGSNDLMQFLFAADRTNPLVASRYDLLSVASLKALKMVIDAGRAQRVPVTLCGEMAGRPLDAMALIGLGFRSISMSPAAIGPVKSMILSLDARRIAGHLEGLLTSRTGSIRADLERFAEGDSVEI